MAEWAGIGPSAASQQAGWRGANVADLPEWSAQVARGERMTRDRVAVTPSLIAEDSLVFGLRMNAGVDLSLLKRRFPDSPWERVEALLGRMASENLAERDGAVVRLMPRGRLLADSIGSELMVAFDRPTQALTAAP